MMVNRQRVVVLVSLASSLVFIALAMRRLDLDGVAMAVRGARFVPWVPLAVACYLGGHLVRGVRCRVLIRSEVQLSLPAATNVVVLGYAVNNILPARVGELARAGMLSRMCGLPFVQCLAVTLVERTFDGLALLLVLVLASSAFPVEPWLQGTLELGTLVFGLASVAIACAMLAPSFLLTMASRLTQWLGRRVHDRTLGLVSQTINGLSYLRNARTFLMVAALSVLVWLIEAGMFLLLLPAFQLRADPYMAMLAMSLTNFGILVPSSPGFIGPFHFFCARALVLGGVSEAVAFSYAVLAHLSFYVPITLWGVGILLSYGISLGKMAATAADARPVRLNGEVLASGPASLRPVKVAATPFMLALTEGLLPVDEDGFDLGERREIVASVAAFVSAQMRDLPGRLAWMFSVGMLGFRALTVLVRFHGLAALPLPERRTWIEFWAYGRFALGRQLFRAVRSTAFVAYYEHALVRDRLLGNPPIVLAKAGAQLG